MELVNKMLEPYEVDYEYVVNNPEIEGEPWYQHYTWTMAQENEFKTWAISRARKVLHCSMSFAQKEVSMLLLFCGLKCSDYNIERS